MSDNEEKTQTGHGFKIFMRIMNAFTAFTLIGFGIAGIIIMSIKELVALRFFLACSPLFLILFGLMLLGSDFNFKIIKKYFLFLKSFLGRGFFNIYLSTVVFFYFSCGNNSDVLAWISAVIIFVMGVFYCIMHCFCGHKDGRQENGESEKQEDTKRQIKDRMM